MSFVAGRAKPTVVGIFGSHSAGKTTLLAAWYLLLGAGHMHGTGRDFAGSLSLAGWEAIAAMLRWAPGQPPGFPPHTASGAARSPGLLHLTFGGRSGGYRDFLFADAPGEWFQRWAINRDGTAAAGARWVSANADVLLLIADRGALSASPGKARNDLQLLSARLSSERRGRPLALVWTKADQPIEPSIEESVRRSVRKAMPDAREFQVSIQSQDGGETGTGLLDLFAWVLESRRSGAELPPAAATSADPLFLVGRR